MDWVSSELLSSLLCLGFYLSRFPSSSIFFSLSLYLLLLTSSIVLLLSPFLLPQQHLLFLLELLDLLPQFYPSASVSPSLLSPLSFSPSFPPPSCPFSLSILPLPDPSFLLSCCFFFIFTIFVNLKKEDSLQCAQFFIRAHFCKNPGKIPAN